MTAQRLSLSSSTLTASPPPAAPGGGPQSPTNPVPEEDLFALPDAPANVSTAAAAASPVPPSPHAASAPSTANFFGTTGGPSPPPAAATPVPPPQPSLYVAQPATPTAGQQPQQPQSLYASAPAAAIPVAYAPAPHPQPQPLPMQPSPWDGVTKDTFQVETDKWLRTGFWHYMRNFSPYFIAHLLWSLFYYATVVVLYRLFSSSLDKSDDDSITFGDFLLIFITVFIVNIILGIWQGGMFNYAMKKMHSPYGRLATWKDFVVVVPFWGVVLEQLVERLIVSFGYALFFFPGLFMQLFVAFALPLLLNHYDMGVWQCMIHSFTQQWKRAGPMALFQLFVFMLFMLLPTYVIPLLVSSTEWWVVVLLSVVAALVCPLYYTCITAAYEDVFGLSHSILLATGGGASMTGAGFPAGSPPGRRAAAVGAGAAAFTIGDEEDMMQQQSPASHGVAAAGGGGYGRLDDEADAEA